MMAVHFTHSLSRARNATPRSGKKGWGRDYSITIIAANSSGTRRLEEHSIGKREFFLVV